MHLIRNSYLFPNQELTFKCQQHHLNLLKRMAFGIWRDDSYDNGLVVPAIDPKRPYGNGWIEGDIAKQLGYEEMDEHYWTEEQIKQIRKVNREMTTVLQICMQCNGIELGVYQLNTNAYEWIKK